MTENIDYLEPLSFRSTLDKQKKISSPDCYYQNGSYRLWRYEIEIEMEELMCQVCKYKLPDGRIFSFEIPSLFEKPRMFFASCLDLASSYGLRSLQDKNVGWNYLIEEHNADKYHLLILGGDQVYADQLFCGCDAFRQWDILNKSEKWTKPWTVEMKQQAECFYFHLYICCWSQGLMPKAMAAIPTVMIWDDHDIIDGWGSLDPHVNNCSVMQGIFPIAKQMFLLFQMGGDLINVINEKSLNGPFSSGYYLTGNVALLLLDARSDRKMITKEKGIVFSESHWRFIENWINNLRAEHLFVVCTTPIVYPHSNQADKLMDIFHSQDLDDSRDHWPAIIHRAELERLLNLLNKFRIENSGHVSILVGDVHQGAYGIVKDRKTDEIIMQQFISSGIGATPPPLIGRFLFHRLFKNSFKLKDFKMKMVNMPNGKNFLPTKNFLSLIPAFSSTCKLSSYVATWFGVPIHNHPLVEPLPSPIILESRVI